MGYRTRLSLHPGLDLGEERNLLKIISYFKKCLICRGLYASDSSSNYMTVSREYVQKLEYRIEELRIDLYKNKEVSC